MRSGWWTGVLLGALCVVVVAARTTQVESGLRSRRRFSSTSTTNVEDSSPATSTRSLENASTTVKSRRREDVQTDVIRVRTRSRPSSRESESSTPSDTRQFSSPHSERSERFSRVNFNRTRKKPIENKLEADNKVGNVEIVRESSTVRSNKRPYYRSSTRTSIRSSSETPITADVHKSSNSPNAKFRPRSRNTTPTSIKEDATQKIIRSRINTRVYDIKTMPDIASSGSSISENSLKMDASTEKTYDIRGSRKLRYKSRLSDTDTNLTLKNNTDKEVNKSSQNRNPVPSQEEISNSPVVDSSTEEATSSTTQSSNTKSSIMRRPVIRRKINFRPSVSLKKSKSDTSEIDEDDNYPESFKALLQAKNTAPQASSSSKENLSVKASQKIYKTHSLPLQSTNTEPGNTHHLRRSYKEKHENKTKLISETASDILNGTEITNDSIQLRKPDYKNRTSYVSRYRKTSTYNPVTVTTISTTKVNSNEKSRYRFNRKLKISTTQPSRSNINSSERNTLMRTSYYNRLRNSRNGSKKYEGSSTASNEDVNASVTTPKPEAVPVNRLSNIEVSTTAKYVQNNDQVNTKPIVIFSSTELPDRVQINTIQETNLEKNAGSLNTYTNVNNVSPLQNDQYIPKLVVSGLLDTNEILNKNEESVSIDEYMYTTSKYHSSYRDESLPTMDIDDDFISTQEPPIKNIQTRKFVGRKHNIEENIRKYSESPSRSTSYINNVTPEPEKSRERFSSRYRSPIERPMYRPTVPTITPATAWLKFYVTDKQLTKSIQTPDWFPIEDHIDLTTPAIGHYIIATSPFIRESSIKLVEGEEMQLGPDINAISFSKTRSTLTSADLKLSESVLASAQLVNVEASNHSPSVTVSIFDALAEILTSTPKPQLLSTTAVTQKVHKNEVILQSHNGVSNKNNVNSLQDLKSKAKTVSTDNDMTTSTNIVQIADLITPNVINKLSVMDNITPALNKNQHLKSTLPNIPNSTPTTPLSARKPFAIKVLYSDKDTPTDILVTASTQNWSWTTDNPPTVLTSVSDIFLSNNNLVSSELTNTLSQNIKNILDSMNENTRAKISVDMANLLKILVPRALDGISVKSDNENVVPDTTPYSLEEILNTEIKEIDMFPIQNSSEITNNNLNNFYNLSQTIGNNISVNIDNSTLNQDLGVNNKVFIAVNSSNTSVNNSTSNSNVVPESVTLWTSMVSSGNLLDDKISSTGNITPIAFIENVPLVDPTNGGSVDKPDGSMSSQGGPVPFFTNFQLNEDEKNDIKLTTSSPTINFLNTLTLPTNLQLSTTTTPFELNTQSPVLVPPNQLWLLSKKADILKRIEDIIKEHNFEIATATNPTLNDIVNNPIPINALSERLTKMVLQLNMTNNNVTETTTFNDQNNTFTLSPITSPPITSSDSSSISSITTVTPFETTTDTMTPDTNLVQNRIAIQTSNNTTLADIVSTTVNDVIETTIVNNIKGESTTDMGAETTTGLNFDTTTQGVFETTTIIDPVLTTSSNNETSSSGILEVSENVSPKKDYVIFGILPNNTVVRKDPNDNVLESLTEASPYIIYGVLPNNTIIRKFPNGTRVPRVMQKIDVLPISPWSLRNPYSPIHNNPAIVKPRSNPFRVSTNVLSSTDATNNGTGNTITTDPVNNNEITISTTTLNINDSSSLGITTVTNKTPAETSTASHVLSLRTTTMLPSVDEILLNSISSAAKEDMVVSAMTSSTREPRILTLDIDPETQQIRTEKPNNGMGASVFKFIPIDEVMVSNQDSNVLKLASTKAPAPFTTDRVETTIQNTETNTTPTKSTVDSSMTSTTQMLTNTSVQTSIPILTTSTEDATAITLSNINNMNLQVTIPPITTTSVDPVVTTEQTETNLQTTINDVQLVQNSTNVVPQGRSLGSSKSSQIIIDPITSTSEEPRTTFKVETSQNNNLKQLQEEAKLLQTLLLSNTQNSGLTNMPDTPNKVISLVQPIKLAATPSYEDDVKRFEEDTKLLLALIAATGQNPDNFKLPTLQKNKAPQVATATTTSTTNRPVTTTQTSPTTTNIPLSSTPSLEDDIRRFQEDAKLLQALLQATGQSTLNLNIPTTPFANSARSPVNTVVTTSTTVSPTTTTTKLRLTTTTEKPLTTTSSVSDDLRKLQEDAILLQTLLQATGQNSGNFNLPIISGVTSNVRVASNPLTTSIMSDTPTTPQTAIRPVFTSYIQSNALPPTTTTTPNIITTLQPRRPLTLTTSRNEEAGISTTNQPFTNLGRRLPSTTVINEAITSRNFRRPTNPTTRRTLASDFTSTTEMPSTSTFSVEEDLQFLNNLKNVLNTNSNSDPETDLANRIIALAVERSLNEIETNKQPPREGKSISGTQSPVNSILAQTTATTTTSTTTTTTRPPTTTTKTTPSIEDDIKQFEEDTKLLKALLQATGQDPSKFNIPTITNAKTNVRISQTTNTANVNDDLKLLSNLLASPSPLNEPFDSLTQNPKKPNLPITSTPQTTTKTNLAVINNDIKKLQDDPKFLQSLIKLQGTQETTTQKSTLAVSGLTGDEALSKLLKQNNNMVPEATRTPVTVSTEFGKSSDALLAALLKEQGFGPSTASSLDEQLRLAALLNQVVVTPKIRRTTTTTPSPAPAQPRRPIIDGIAWLWQQWRETAPGPPRPNRKPPAPAASSTATSNRVNWFGSGPFVGNAPEPTNSNRIPLEPPRAVVAEQTPGRGQIVSAAINVTRAFSQFLGAAIQGAAQTVQNVIKAGQKAATDVYTNGSG